MYVYAYIHMYIFIKNLKFKKSAYLYYTMINDWKQYKGAKTSQMPQLYFVIWRDETIKCFYSRLVRALLDIRGRRCEL